MGTCGCPDCLPRAAGPLVVLGLEGTVSHDPREEPIVYGEDKQMHLTGITEEVGKLQKGQGEQGIRGPKGSKPVLHPLVSLFN